MKKHSSGYTGNKVKGGSALRHEQDMDVSLLQRPLQTAFAGFQEAKRAFEDGTSEVRRLLLEECSLIYECNVCRNMFRSLANFISHKRVFCVELTSFGFHNDSHCKPAMVLQTKADDTIDLMKRSRSTGSSPTPTAGRQSAQSSLRDISRVIERLRREKAPIAGRSAETKATVLQLESVPTSKHAVYQTVKQQENDSIKTEIDEVHQLLTKPQPTVLGPDGKVMTRNACIKANDATLGSKSEISGIMGEGKMENYVCEICKLAFQTEKTLKIHEKKHSLSAYVFQCPACSLTFLQAAAVIRHLSKEHKKPTRRIRLMRESILKRCMQQGDVQMKGPNRELKRLQMSEASGKEAGGTVEAREQRKIMSSCIYCEKSFERRAALSTHLLNCRAKQEALQKPPPPVRRHNSNETISDISTIKANVKQNEDNSQSMKRSDHAIKSELNAEEDANYLNKIFADLADKQSFGAGLQTVSFDKLESQESESASVSDETAKLDANNDSQLMTNNNDEQSKIKTKEDKFKFKKSRNVPAEKLLNCRCKICSKQFNALSNVRRHISMFHYRARRFGCKLCDYRAFRRYDIVNHLGFVHQFEGDREQLSTDYVTTHDCKYTKEDIDGDIVLLNDDIDELDECPATNATADDSSKVVEEVDMKPIKTYEKRLKRKKINNESPAQQNASDKIEDNCATRIKLRRSRNEAESKCIKDAEKRPIRKRIKAENKDFVYDLSRLLKNDTGQPLPKRRNASEDSDITEPRMQRAWSAYITAANKSLVQGISRRIMMQLVSQGRAVSASLPELPAERPQMRPRLTSFVRSEATNQTVVIGTMDVDKVARPKSTIFNNSFIERIAKRTAAANSGAQEQSAIENLKRKVDAALQQKYFKADADTGDNTTQLTHAELPDEGELQQQQQQGGQQLELQKKTANVECKTPVWSNGKQFESSVPKTPTSPPRSCLAPLPTSLPTPPLDNVNLIENSTLESLLRTALQN